MLGNEATITLFAVALSKTLLTFLLIWGRLKKASLLELKQQLGIKVF